MVELHMNEIYQTLLLISSIVSVLGTLFAAFWYMLDIFLRRRHATASGSAVPKKNEEEADEHNLKRFLDAQLETTMDLAIQEINAGRKDSCWMWYVFPQVDGLSRSDKSKFYAIKSKDEAVAYLQNPTLKSNIKKACGAVHNYILLHPNQCPMDIVKQMFRCDTVKVKSSLTFVECVSQDAELRNLATQLLDSAFKGTRCKFTKSLLL